MKKLIACSICILMLVCCVFSLSACVDDEGAGDASGNALTIEEIAERLYYLDEQGEIELADVDDDEAEGWTYEINEELEYYHDETPLQGVVLSVYYTDDETYILEFESVSDAKKAMSTLAYWENEWDHIEWEIIREGKIVMFGEKDTIDLILDRSDNNIDSASGSYSAGLLFELDDSNPYYVVAGIGRCTDSKVIIPDEYDGLPVKEIGNYAFESCSTIREVVLPNSITHIGHHAFNDCENLKKATLPNSLQTIGRDAFASTGLTAIELPEGLIEVGSCAFLGCKELKSVSIPSSMKYIRNSCFSSCWNLENVDFSEGLITIESGAFSTCESLSEINLPQSLEKLEGAAFVNCTGLYSIAIPENVTVVGATAFRGCSWLEVIYNYTGKNLDYLLDYTGSNCRIVNVD